MSRLAGATFAAALLFSSCAHAGEKPSKALDIFGSLITIRVDSRDNGGLVAVVEEVDKPGNGPPRQMHTREDEVLYVLKGTYRIWHGGEIVEGGPGTVMVLPRNVPHTFQNVGKTSGRVMVVIIPGGQEGFFKEVDRRRLKMPTDEAEINALRARYGLAVLGPPPAK